MSLQIDEMLEVLRGYGRYANEFDLCGSIGAGIQPGQLILQFFDAGLGFVLFRFQFFQFGFLIVKRGVAVLAAVSAGR